MGFSDEVEAFRTSKADTAAWQAMLEKEQAEQEAAERARLDALRAAARDQLNAELASLWQATKEYWEASAVPLNEHQSRTIGPLIKALGQDGSVGARPFPRIDTFAVPGSKGDLMNKQIAEHLGFAYAPADPAEAISINGWFALSAPGELRAIPKVGDRPAYFYEADTSVTLGDPKSPAFCVVFRGEFDTPDVAVRCTPDGPTELFVQTGDGWDRQGLLRDYVVAAVADLPLDRWAARRDG